MRRSLAVHVAANWAALTTTLIFGFFLTPFMLHRLGDAAFGLWVLMASLGGYTPGGIRLDFAQFS